MINNLLMLTLFVPLFTVSGIICLNNTNENGIKNVSLWGAVFAFVLSFISCFLMNKAVNIDAIFFMFHISKMSLYFMTITSFVVMVSVAIGRYECSFFPKKFNSAVMGIEALLFLIFTNENIVTFYVLIVMMVTVTFILINHFTSKLARKIFTLQSIGVLCLFCGIVYVVHISGTDDISSISQYAFSIVQERIVFWTMMPLFIVLSAMFPFHSSMIDTLSIVPTSVAIIVSNICMRLSAFGIIFILLQIAPHACATYQMLVASICILAIFCSIIEMMFFQNLKQVVAGINIIVSAIIILGMFSLNTAGESGSLLCMSGYSITTVGLYLFVYLIEKYSINCSIKIKGLIHKMPTIAILSELSILSIGAVPLLPCFFGEVALMTAFFDEHIILCCLLGSGFIAFNFISFAIFQKTIFGEDCDKVTINKCDIFMVTFVCISVLLVGLASPGIQRFTTSAINDSRIKDLYKNVDL